MAAQPVPPRRGKLAGYQRGGIDLDALRKGKEAIKLEVNGKVPQLIAEGGYIPLADGRIREDILYENYAYYRTLLEEVINVV